MPLKVLPLKRPVSRSEPRMFDEGGRCKYCAKPTRAKATSLCDACFKLDLAIKNNPVAARLILKNYTESIEHYYAEEYNRDIDEIIRDV